jgi:hypothetical protein
MFPSFVDVQKIGRDNLDAATKSIAAVSRSLQALAADSADYTRRSFETSATTLERLAGARSLDKAVEIQADYARSAYEALVAQSARLGDAFTDLAKETTKPFEGLLAKASGK